MLRCLAAIAVVALLGVLAAPAEGTLRVRSDGGGLLVQDLNGLNDDVVIAGNGNPYLVKNRNPGDIFKFDRQFGCEQGNAGDEVFCIRSQPAVAIALGGGNDKLVMDPPLFADPPLGNYVVSGGPGIDDLLGHPGTDELRGNAGNDILHGGIGDDTLLGGDNADSLRGWVGRDVLRGGTGNDFILAREEVGSAVDDGVDCDVGFDTVDADLQDRIQADCEEIDRSPVGETPHVRILNRRKLTVSRSGKVSVGLRCPSGVGGLGCNGRLSLRLDTSGATRASRSRPVRYRIRAGKRKVVSLRLTSRDVLTLTRRQRRGRKTRGVLTSVERGRKGPKTTIRRPQLQLQRAT